MTEAGFELQRRMALIRRDDWQRRYDAAMAADDVQAAASAADFILHYDAMLQQIDQKSR
jgi:hypothetical protein